MKTFRHQEKKEQLKCTDRIAKQARSFKNYIKKIDFWGIFVQDQNLQNVALKHFRETLKTAADNHTKHTHTQNHA